MSVSRTHWVRERPFAYDGSPATVHRSPPSPRRAFSRTETSGRARSVALIALTHLHARADSRLSSLPRKLPRGAPSAYDYHALGAEPRRADARSRAKSRAKCLPPTSTMR